MSPDKRNGLAGKRVGQILRLVHCLGAAIDGHAPLPAVLRFVGRGRSGCGAGCILQTGKHDIRHAGPVDVSSAEKSEVFIEAALLRMEFRREA